MVQQHQQQQQSTPASPGAFSGTKRKVGDDNVDNAFERLFGYSWGTSFALQESKMTKAERQLVDIFGCTKAARILNARGSIKRRRIEQQRVLNYTDIQLPKSTKSAVTEEVIFAGQVVQTAKRTGDGAPTKATTKKANGGNIDSVLAQLGGPSKMNTVQKTSNDWETFKESDKQLQDDLEKRAQGKDAFLVKQDFLNRVDHRKFELEREERDRDRAKRGQP